MQKNTISVKNADNKRLKKHLDHEPSSSTIKNILQFAASYQAEKISDNQFVGLILN